MALTAPRKEITLPVSGEKLVIRSLGPADYSSVGGIPDTLIEMGVKKRQGIEPSVDDLKKLDPKSLSFTQGMAVAAIVVHPTGQKIVYKLPEHCDSAAGEFSFYDLKSRDQEFLIEKVFAFTGEDTAAAKSFPKKKKRRNRSAHAG